jgi:hypothetical protein
MCCYLKIKAIHMKRSIISWGWALATILITVSSSSASTFTYDFNSTFSGNSPAGSPPWLQATFTDSGLPANTVQLTVSAVNLSSSEYVSCWYFNLNPSLDPTLLNFATSGSVGAFGTPTIQTGENSFRAAGDGKYDVLFAFDRTGGAPALFGNGDSVTFTITGIPGLNAGDFNFLSAPAGGGGPYISAAHVVSGDQGGWVDPASILHNSLIEGDASVPDASTTLPLLGASLLALGIFWKRFQS